MKTKKLKFWGVLAVEVNFKILQSKAIKSDWKNKMQVCFSTRGSFDHFPTKIPLGLQGLIRWREKNYPQYSETQTL